MRKLSFLLLSAAMLFSLVGCGKDVSATSDSSSSTTNEVVMESPKGETEVIETTEEENQQLNNEASEDETETLKLPLQQIMKIILKATLGISRHMLRRSDTNGSLIQSMKEQ